MAANLIVNRTTTFFNDQDEVGTFDPGDVLYTRVTITNNGDQNATNVTFEDTFTGTTLVAGTLNISPIAFNDSFTAVANTVLRVGGAGTIGGAESTTVAGNLLTNDRGSSTLGTGVIVGDSVPGFQLDTVTNGVTAKGGIFNIFADGSFNYVNDGNDTEADLTAGDSFTYTIRDAGLDGTYNTADDLLSTATVTITFSTQSGVPGTAVNRVWYVDGNANTDGTGTSVSPFQSSQIATKLNGGSDVDAAGHYIYVENGATGSIALEANQQLIGTGAALTVGGFNIASAGANSTLSAPSGTIVTLATDNVIAGINLGSGTGTATALSGSNFGTLTVNNAVLNAGGQALSLSTGTFAGSGFTSTSSAGGTNNVSFTDVTGTVALGSGALSGATGASFNLVNTGAANGLNVTYGGSITQGNNAALINVAGGTNGHNGTLTFTGALGATNGTGLQLNNADGTYNFNGNTTLAGGDAGIDIIGGSSGTFNFGVSGSTTTAITSPTGIALRIDSSDAAVTYNGNITQANNAALVDITNHAGGKTVTFQNGTLSATNGSGLQFSNADGTYNFNGTNTLNGGDAGIDIDTGSAGTFSFSSNSSINHSANAGHAFVVDTSTANVTYSGTITDNSGRAVSINEHDGGSITFGGAITANGAGATGIHVTNSNNSGTIAFNSSVTLTTQANGAVTLSGNTGKTINFAGGGTGLDIDTTSGTGFSATGGGTVSVSGTGNTIVATTGTALNVVSTNIGANDLNFVSISKNGGTVPGIILNGTGSAGGLNITGTGSANSGGTIQNVTGLANDGIVLNNTSDFNVSWIQITNIGGHAINATNLGGSNSIANSLISNWDQTDTATKNGLNLVNLNTNMTAMIVTNTTFDGNTTNNPANPDGSDGILMEAQGTSAMNLRVEDSIFRHMFGDGIQVSSTTGSTGTVNVRIIDNDFLDSVPYSGGPGVGGGNGGISITPFGGTVGGASQQFTVLVQDNVMSNIMKPISNAGAIGGTSGQNVNADITIQNNTISDLLGGRGITFTVDGGDWDGKIIGNTVNTLGSPTKHAIAVNFTNNLTLGTNGSGDVQIVNNTVGNTGPLWTDAGGGDAEAVIITTQAASTMTALLSGNVITANTVFEALRARAGGTSTMNVTITNNNVTDTLGTRTEIDVAAGYISGQGGTINSSLTGNNVNGGNIRLRELNLGTLNVTQASAAAVTAANNGGAVVVTGTPQFGSAAPPLPADPLLPPAFIMAEAPPPAAPETEEPADGGLVDTPQVDNGGGGAGDGATNDQYGDPVPADDGDTGPVVVDDGVLSQAELDLIVGEAIARWIAAGATEAQVAAMRATAITVADLAGLQLAESGNGTITLDVDAAGWRWFVDATPGADEEYAGSGTVLAATDANGHAGTRIDLLTVIMHELGHQIGLSDIYAPGEMDELMYGTIRAGERRLPGSDDLQYAQDGPVAGAFAFSPMNLGSLEPGRIVTIEWRHTIDNPGEDRLAGYWTGTSIADSDQTVAMLSQTQSGNVDALALGNFVYLDANKNGMFDAGDSGLAGVTLLLFADTNNDGDYDQGVDLAIVYEDVNGNDQYDAGIDNPLAAGSTGANVKQLSAITDVNGNYSFTGLAPGDYIVVVPASNFGAGVLGNKVAHGSPADPNAGFVNNDNNAEQFLIGQPGTYAATRAIRLDYGLENVAGPNGTALDTNDTLDLGFDQPNQPPAGANATIPIDEDEARTLTDLDFPITDPENNTLHEVVINSVSGGTLSVNGTDVTTFPATITLAQLTGNQVVFTPTQDLNGTGAAVINFQVRDNGGTANGGVDLDQSANTLTFNIAAVNDQVFANNPSTLTVTEDTPKAITGLSISDVDAALAPSGVYVVTLSSTEGTLTLSTLTGLTFSAGDGTDDATMTFRGTLADINTALATATYSPNADYSGPADISFQVTDDFGGTLATGSGTATQDGDTIMVTVLAVNDAPVVDLNGAVAGIDNAASYTENDPAVVLAAGIAVSDVDNPTLTGATVTIAGVQAGDLLTIGGLTSGSVGAVTFSYNSGTGVMTLGGTASPADYQAALKDIAYSSTSENPGSGRTISWTATDGSDSSVAATTTLSITSVNDAPLVSGDGEESLAAVDEDSVSADPNDHQTVDQIFGGQFTDPDGTATLAGVAVVGNDTSGTAGQWQYWNGASWADIGAASNDAAVALTAATPIRFAPNLDYNGPAPTLTVRLVESGGAAFANGDPLDTDPNGGATRYSSGTVTLDQSFNAVNDNPVIDLNGAGAGTSTSNGAFEQDLTGTGSLAPDATVTDVDSADFDTGTLTVEITANAQAGDIVSVQNYTDGGGNDVTVSGNEISYNGTVVATFTAGDHDTALVITFDADATPTAAQYVARAVYFAHNSDSPSAAARTLTYTLTDGDGGSGSATATVNVTPDNDAPASTAPTDATISWTEDTAPVALMQGVVLSDVDLPASFAGGSLTIDVSGGEGGINFKAGSLFSVSAGRLIYDDAGTPRDLGAISLIGTTNVAVTGLTAEATLARLNDLVDDFTFFIFGDNPTPGDRTVTMTFDDGNNTGSGADVALTTVETQTLTVVAVNDAPSIDLNGAVGGIDNAAAYTENASPAVLAPDLVVADPDDTNIEGATVSIGTGFIANADALTIGGLADGTTGTGGAIAFSYDATTGVMTLTGSASKADYQAALRLVAFSSTSDDPEASRSIDWTISDGDLDSATATTTVTVTEVNDAPSSASNTVSTSEDDDYEFQVADFKLNYADAENHDISGVLIDGLPLEGELLLDGVAVSDGQFIDVQDIIDGKLIFRPDADEFNSPYATFGFRVRDTGGTDHGGANTDGTTRIMTINVTPDNLPPVVDLNGGDPGIDYATTFSEGGAAVAIGADITVTDPDSGIGDMIESAIVTITDPVAGDLLALAGALPSGISVDPSSTNTMLKLVGTASQSDYQAALALVRYSSSSDDPAVAGTDGARTITVVLNDGMIDSAAATATVAIDAVNDAPVNSVPGQQAWFEDSDLVFSTLGGNAITISDGDAGEAALTVTVVVNNGRLTLGSLAGVSVSGNGTTTVTLSGTVAAINNALDGLTYRGNLNYQGADTLTILTSDGGASGSGGAKTDVDQVSIILADDGFINGDGGDNVLTGTPQRDVFLVQQGGNDTVAGLAGNDTFYFGGAFTSADSVDGGDGPDVLVLQGDYSGGVTFGTGATSNIVSVESISLFSGSITTYGDIAGNSYSYDLTMLDANVAAGERLRVNGSALLAGENFTFDGSDESDGSFLLYGGKGVDNLTGGANSDVIVFAHDGRFGAGDVVNGGGGYDFVFLRGDYAIDFNAVGFAGSLVDVESVGLLSFSDTQYAGGGDGEFDYAIVWNDAMLAAGQTITFNGSRLGAAETMSFDGSSESSGHFRLWGGAAADTLTGGGGNDLIYGGLGADTLSGNGGADTFRYHDVLESTSAATDSILGFAHGIDRIDLNRIDANPFLDDDQAFSFIGASSFSGGGSASVGELRAFLADAGTNLWQVEGDVDGDGTADLVIQVYVEAGQPLTAGDFIL